MQNNLIEELENKTTTKQDYRNWVEKNIRLYSERYSTGKNIWTGEKLQIPLNIDDIEDWEDDRYLEAAS